MLRPFVGSCERAAALYAWVVDRPLPHNSNVFVKILALILRHFRSHIDRRFEWHIPRRLLIHFYCKFVFQRLTMKCFYLIMRGFDESGWNTMIDCVLEAHFLLSPTQSLGGSLRCARGAI